jgi:hypothetical protein
MPEGVKGIPSPRPRVSAREIILRRRRRYFFLALALVLLAVFDLAADFVVFPDPHPQRLHAICAPLSKRTPAPAGPFTYVLSATS